MDRVLFIGKTYRHFKGKEYKVLFIATDSETNEEIVVYEALYGKHLIWTMRLSKFNSYVDDNTLRFELVG